VRNGYSSNILFNKEMWCPVPLQVSEKNKKQKAKAKPKNAISWPTFFFLSTQLFLTGGQVRQLLIGDRAQKSRRAPGHTNVSRESPIILSARCDLTNDECMKIAPSGECEYVPSDASNACQQPPNEQENTLTSGTQMIHRRYPLLRECNR
jgi:hypothetical protein